MSLLNFRPLTRITALLPALTLALPQPAYSGSTVPFTGTGFAPTGQAGAQQQAGNNNSLASNLGKAAAVLSMAAGGLYMAKGATQLKCCSSGCSGSGAASQETKKNLDKSTTDKASTIKRQPVDYFHLRFPTQAGCPARTPFTLFDLFRPAPADAALGPCLDALIALTTGGLMLLNGIMALQAANQADQMAGTSLGNAGNMGSYPGTGGIGTSPTPDKNPDGGSGIGTSKLGSGGGTQNPIKMDPALLRTGKANDIMTQFEKQFGINRDQFAKDVLAGQDPRQLLGSAPNNPLSNADMNKATSGAKGMSDADKAKALDGTALDAAQRELASKLGGKEDYAVNPGGGPAAPSKGGLFGSKKEGEEKAGEEEAAQPSLAVSPEVQAALDAKVLEDRRNGITDLTIFEVVHQKYREKSKMIFGYDPDQPKEAKKPHAN